MSEEQSVDVLESFVGALSAAGAPTDADARMQIFKPTVYPDTIVVSPGIVVTKPTGVEYAPDIEVARAKIKTLTYDAKMGKIAVINISVEPGSGKTIHLPFKFTESNCLVVLPTVFDAWSAHMAAGQMSNISVYGFATQHQSTVTYTDSYHAAYMLSTGVIKQYNMVFVDESHSQDGVTMFMASVCVPGVIFVRMTATPPAIDTRPKRSFPIVDERALPKLSDVTAVAEFVTSRSEPRVVVMAPSSESAELIASSVPSSSLLTPTSPLQSLKRMLSTQSEPAIIVTDAVCSKGINLNLDVVIDFGLIGTPTGVRPITKREQLQRRLRVGRNKPGVYCCPLVATGADVPDDYSVFRNNLWFILNNLDPEPCKFPHVSRARASELLRVYCEPASVPVFVPPPHAMSVSDSASTDSFDRADVDSVRADMCALDVHDDVDSVVADDLDVPSWFMYYVARDNHPSKYVGDLVHDHRKVRTDGALIAADVVASPVVNRLSVDYKVSSDSSSSSGFHSRSASDSSASRLIEMRSYSTSSSSNPVVVKQTKTRGSTRERSLVEGVMERRYRRAKAQGLSPGAPLHLTRSVKDRGTHKSTVYKALAVSGDFAVETGLVLASSGRAHKDLQPLSPTARKSLSSQFSDDTLHRATHYLSWTVAHSLDSLDVPLWVAEAKRVGAWAVPPNNVVPAIDLQTDYHSSWVTVVTDRVRNKLVLPPIVPRVGWPRRANRSKSVPSSVLDDALDVCENPSYTVPEQQSVYRAWNVLAMRSSSVAPQQDGLYDDANILLAYMSAADRLAEFE